MGAFGATPALFTRISIEPSILSNRLIISPDMERLAVRKVPPISSESSFNFVWFLPVKITLAPLPESALAQASPMPLDAPVTNAILFFNFIFFGSWK